MQRRKGRFARLSADEVALLVEIMARHPRRKSACSALIAELELAEESAPRRLLDVIGTLRCRKAVRVLGKLADRLEARVPLPVGEWGSGTAQEVLLRDVFIVLGSIDSPRSQGVLRRFLLRSKNPIVRADAMEAMAWGYNFDPEIIWPYVSMECTIPEILSALYALGFERINHGKSAEEVEERIRPLLGHSYPHIRRFCLRLLEQDASHRELVASMLADPHVGAEAAQIVDAMDS